MMYFKLSSRVRISLMDKPAQMTAVYAALVLFSTVFSAIILFLINPKVYIENMHFIFVAVFLAIIQYAYMLNRAIIGAVYRHKDGMNKEIYENHKDYFDKKFASYAEEVRKDVEDDEDTHEKPMDYFDKKFVNYVETVSNDVEGYDGKCE